MWDGTANMGFSLDYILRFTAPCEMRFSLSWINAKTGDDFWLTNDHKEQLHLADFIRQDYSIVAIEVAAYHIIPIVQNASALTELDFYYGGGLWGGIILGGAEKYAISCIGAESIIPFPCADCKGKNARADSFFCAAGMRRTAV